MRNLKKLPKEFYLNGDVVQVAKDLIGKYLLTNIDGSIAGGIIVECEAYNGRRDKACHAYGNRRTNRTSVMYMDGGVAYVYLCYGIHHLFNIVTNVKGLADAVLIRAIEPLVGVEKMEERRHVDSSKPALTSGPGSMSKALGIGMQHYGTDLGGSVIWLAENPDFDFEVQERKRVGVDYAGEDALLPWRFIMKGNKWVSKPNF